MGPNELTLLEKANLKLKCAEIAIVNGTRVDMSKDACMEVAKKIYAFALGTTKEAPNAEHGTG